MCKRQIRTKGKWKRSENNFFLIKSIKPAILSMRDRKRDAFLVENYSLGGHVWYDGKAGVARARAALVRWRRRRRWVTRPPYPCIGGEGVKKRCVAIAVRPTRLNYQRGEKIVFSTTSTVRSVCRLSIIVINRGLRRSRLISGLVQRIILYSITASAIRFQTAVIDGISLHFSQFIAYPFI